MATTHADSTYAIEDTNGGCRSASRAAPECNGEVSLQAMLELCTLVVDAEAGETSGDADARGRTC